MLTLKCFLKMTKRDCKYPTPPCALAKILPEATVRAQFVKSRILRPLLIHFLLFQSTNLLIPCMYTRGESQGASSGFGLWAKTLWGQKLVSCHFPGKESTWICFSYLNVYTVIMTLMCLVILKIHELEHEPYNLRNTELMFKRIFFWYSLHLLGKFTLVL